MPVDTALHARLSANWPAIKLSLIAEVNETFHVFDDKGTFKEGLFTDYVIRNDLPWPVLPSGQLALDDDTFDDMCRFHPQLRPLYEVRASLGQNAADWLWRSVRTAAIVAFSPYFSRSPGAISRPTTNSSLGRRAGCAD